MELDYAVLADEVRQRPDGKLDILGAGVDVIRAGQLPVTHEQIALALRLSLSREEAERDHRLDVRFLDPDGGEVARGGADVPGASPERLDLVPPGHRLGVGTVLAFTAVEFRQFGPHEITITWDGQEAHTPLPVTVSPPPPTPAPPPATSPE